MKDKQDIPRAAEFKYSRHRGQGDVYSLGWQVSVIAFKKGKKSKWNTRNKETAAFPPCKHKSFSDRQAPRAWGVVSG